MSKLSAAWPQQAVLVAGGLGSRLGSIARDLPKPLLPVQGIPVIERLVASLREAGVASCTVVTCHRAEQVEAHLGDGRNLGVRIDYLREPEPLGTAGFLGLLPRPEQAFFLVNADIITDLRFQVLAEWHARSGAAATLAVRSHATTCEYGVVEFDRAGRLTRYREKPVHEAFIGMGIYCLAPAVCGHVAAGEVISMPEVLGRLVAAGEAVFCHRHDGVWCDIGRPEDYERCQRLQLPGDALPAQRRAA